CVRDEYGCGFSNW
nr:immunoglobulin heavy chain junction region [Macaca mulatta]MOV46702.1 immunoglobulin heavy chain junction region [Macaca mulatta]